MTASVLTIAENMVRYMSKCVDETKHNAAAHSERGQWEPSANLPVQATSERPATSGTPHPRYRMTEMPVFGITRVVPWNFPPLTFVRGVFYFPEETS